MKLSALSLLSGVCLLALGIGGCGDQTSILVEVTSDLRVPGQVDGLHLTVSGVTGTVVADETYALTSNWPHTVSLRPGEMENTRVTIEVEALLDGSVVASRTAVSMFEEGRQVRVTIIIEAACMGVECPVGQVCQAGECVSVTMPDLGPIDGGGDQGLDMGDMDVPDMPACDPELCDDGIACTIDRCETDVCRNEPDDSLCEEGTTCDPATGCPPRLCEADSQCADGVACNGAEICDAMSCAAGTPIDCDDMDACTDDLCDEELRGECRHVTRDRDGDGFGDMTCPELGGVEATDCNDDNEQVFPGSVEVCNGLDDDCNGVCDETSTCCRGTTDACMTSCGTTGTRVCGSTCSWSVCAPPAETCNGADDDCNGAPDDVFECIQGAVETCTTTCGSTGSRTCDASCGWGPCEPPAESCNGLDDDCSMGADDIFDCIAASESSCTTSCGSTGTRTCDPGTCTLGTCQPPAEGCTGADDDCDGSIDESAECTAGETAGCTTSCGSAGTRTCSAMCTFGSCAPPVETCNGADDDCDGSIDEAFTCVPGAVGSCGTGCGTTGSRTCTTACEWGTCTPPVEACNGADDDCDSMCDETFACCAGTSGSCTTSCGTTGTRTCNGACSWSACSPPPESCNGVDDDCNGACDDGFTCCAGRTGTCTTTCGSTGSRVCSASCGWGTCAPPAEVCSGSDEDCDGSIDEDFSCSPGQMGSCTTTCGSTGTAICDAGCAFGSCTPPTEACNGVDDDCDGTTDEGCGACGSCPGGRTIAAPGGRYDVTLSASATTGSCGGSGSEGSLTFTTTATSDVFITTHQAVGIDTVLYVRSCQCNGAEQACNDDADGSSTSMLRLTNLAAGTYNVFVDTKAAMSGSLPVDVYITAPGSESDRCGNPTPISAGTAAISGTTCGFGADYSPPTDPGCSLSAAGEAEDRVYYFIVPTSRSVTFSGCNGGTTFDTTIFVRNDCVDDSAPSVECNDDGCMGGNNCTGGYRSSLTTTLAPGVYYFVASGYAGPSCPCGNYQFDLSGI